MREGSAADFEATLRVVRAADAARRVGRQGRAFAAERMRAYIENPDSFLIVAEAEGGIVGMALGMQGLAEDGAGPPVEGLCHVGAVFVSPERWGEGVGGRLVDRTLREARARGYDRAQLWTHEGNARARRLYEGCGFAWSGREGEDDAGETTVHYVKSAL